MLIPEPVPQPGVRACLSGSPCPRCSGSRTAARLPDHYPAGHRGEVLVNHPRRRGSPAAQASAPSLPADIHGVGLDTDPLDEAPPELASLAAGGAARLIAAAALSLGRAARLAQDPKDRTAAERASRDARDLASLYAQHDA
jgi:hypothetical protein